jgi:hypothetical protein
VRKENINFSDNAIYFLNTLEQQENLIPIFLKNFNNLDERDENKFKELYFNNIINLLNLKLESKIHYDSIEQKLNEELSKITKRKLIEETKISNRQKLLSLKDSLLVEEKNKGDILQKLYLQKLDTLILNAKIKLENEEIKRFRIKDSIQRVNDSLNIIQKQKIEKENLEKRKKDLLEQQKREEEQKIKNEQRKNLLISRFGREYGEVVFNRKIRIGMTEEMLIESWGKPQRINKTITKYGTRKQYVYGSSQYVYIGEDGTIETIQSSN